MRSVPADQPRAGSPLRRRLAAACTGLILLAGAGCGGDLSIAPPSASSDSQSSRTTDGKRAVDAWIAALNARDAAAYDGAIDPRFKDELNPLLDNATKVDVGTIEGEFVDSAPGALSSDEAARFGKGAFVAAVRLRYQLADDSGPSAHETAVVLARDDGEFRVAAVGGHGSRTPVWLAGPVQVDRAGDVTVFNGGTTPSASLLGQGQRAVRDVRRVLPKWRGRLILEVPRDKEALDTVLAAEPTTYDNIAGVTTTADGSVVPGAPVHVFLNPRVFLGLKERGAQVVMTHEATHVATGASFAAMPQWLLEGFADYVALASVDVPVRQAARQTIAQMKKDGLPTTLPTPEDLEPTADNLGATYELAWLACRYLGQRWGQEALVRFYRSVDDGASVQQAFTEELGVTEAEFVKGWRADLKSLVGPGVSG